MSDQSLSMEAEPSEVLPHLLLGSKAHAKDRELLRALGVTHVLNVTPPKTVDPVAGVPNFFEKDEQLTYRRCAIYDNKAEDISSVLEGCIAFIDQAKFYGRILVHCNKGVSRSVSMVVAYLMNTQDKSFEDAMAMVVDRRPVANPNESFRRQLKQYGQRLQRAKKTKPNRGPCGPSLPPTAEKPRSAAAIGPQLPPHLAKKLLEQSESEELENDTQKPASENSTAEQDDEAQVIGPCLPSSFKRARSDESVNSDNAGAGESSPKKPRV